MSEHFKDMTDDELKREFARSVAAIPSFVRIDLDSAAAEEQRRMAQKLYQASIDASSTDNGLDILSELLDAQLKTMYQIPNKLSKFETTTIVRNIGAFLEILIVMRERGVLSLSDPTKGR